MPIESRGNVVANWNHAISDLDDHRHWIAGALEVRVGLPTFGTVLRGAGPVDPDTGRRGLNGFYADSTLLFRGQAAAPGRIGSPRRRSTWTRWRPIRSKGSSATPTPSARSTTSRCGRSATAGRPIPNGWNSWTGSGSTGGLGTNIDPDDHAGEPRDHGARIRALRRGLLPDRRRLPGRQRRLERGPDALPRRHRRALDGDRGDGPRARHLDPGLPRRRGERARGRRTRTGSAIRPTLRSAACSYRTTGSAPSISRTTR